MSRNTTLLLGVLMVIVALYFWQGSANVDSPTSTVEQEIESTAHEKDEVVEVQIDPAPVRFPEPSPMDPKKHTFFFDNGREVTVTLQQRPESVPYLYPTSRFIDIYDDLVLAAENGSSSAAVQLYLSLKGCQTAYSSQADLGQALAKIRDEGIIEWPGNSRPSETVPTGLDYTQFAENLASQYAQCQGVSSDQAFDIEQWARIAVDVGDYMGTRLLVEEIGPSQESFELWQNAWEQGHINAATGLLLLYRKGVPEHLNGQPDYIQTYAYQLVRNMMYEAASEYSSYSNSNRLQAMDNALRGTGGFLTPQEQAEAENLAADLMESNANCCIGSWGWRN